MFQMTRVMSNFWRYLIGQRSRFYSPPASPALLFNERKDTGDVYIATSNSAIYRIRERTSESSTGTWQTKTVIGGWVCVRVGGYNLGATQKDVLHFSVRGVKCSNVKRESSSSLVCVFGDPVVTADLGKVRRFEPSCCETQERCPQ